MSSGRVSSVPAPPVLRDGAPVRTFNRLLAALPAAELASLTPAIKDVGLERGTVLQRPGDAIEHVYFPHSGMISVVVVMQTGEEVETATIGREGALGTGVALGSRHATSRALVQLPGMAARIPAAQFVAAASRSAAIRDIAARYNTLLIAQIQQSVACNALHDAEARLCRWLLSCSDRVNSDTIPLTQEFLGQMLGVRRTTVTIVARMLQAAGMIRYRRGVIQIIDRAALEEGACECYATTRRHIEWLLPEKASDLSA
jgi:CRP-like cAMP-binding protein